MSNKSYETMHLVQRYYENIMSKKEWDTLLSDDLLLTGTVAQDSRGKTPYINNNFFNLVKKAKVKEMLVDGRSAFALVNYDLLSPKGKTMNLDVAEFWKVKERKLDSVAIFFDTAAFRNFMT
jgi:ketosteroid isomerase-like protein